MRSWGVLCSIVAVVGCTTSGEQPTNPTSTRTYAVSVATELRARLHLEIARRPVDLQVDFSVSASAPLRIERDGQPGVSLSIVASGLRDRRPSEVDDRTRVFVDALEGTDVVQTTDVGSVEELRWLRIAQSTVTLRYEVTLGPALARLRVASDFVEALDPNGVARLRTAPAYAVDSSGARRLLRPSVERLASDRFALSFTLDAEGMRPPIAIDPAWSTTASLAVARDAAAAAMLPGKKVIIAGGRGDRTDTEIYDAATSSWTSGPPLLIGRTSPAVATLSDGRVMFCAGIVGATNASADIYDPTSGTFKAATLAPVGFRVPVPVMVGPDRVLFQALGGSVVYDGKLDTWTVVTPATVRVGHGAVRLPSGKALIVGGTDSAGTVLSAAEEFDPSTNTFATVGSLATARKSFSIVIANGKALVIGGDNGASGTTILDSVEVYDPSTSKWSAGPKMPTRRRSHRSLTLPDSRVLTVGGETLAALDKSAIMLDATSTTWLAAGALAHGREDFPLVPIDSAVSAALAIGGYDGGIRKDVEVFAPEPAGIACAGAGECATGSCVDGFCCEKAACAADETCGGTGAPGKCKKKNGQACIAGDACGSGNCVDGFCCNTACTGLCEACDVVSTPGSCTTLAPGDKPHGTTRGACAGDGACQSLCGGVDAKACTVFPGAATTCGTASCKDGQESPESFCDGAGKCAAAATSKCEPFACGASSCRKACAADTDCATGFTCATRSGKCVFGAKCDGDHTVLVPGASSIDCTPYRCAGAVCLAKCASTDDCAAGTTCDVGTGVCTPVASDGGSAGGCALDGRSSPNASLEIVVLVLLGLRKLRRNVREDREVSR